MYNYEEFKQKLEELVKDMVQEKGLEVRMDTFPKNNDIPRDVIIIYGPELLASPSIGVHGLYQGYIEYEDMDIVLKVIKDILSNELDKGIFEVIKSWELAKDRIGIKLINHELNENRLGELPHKQILDLDMICYINLFDQEHGASVEVKYPLLNFWGITENELWHFVKLNCSREEYVLRNMSDIMTEMGMEDVAESPMYILTNESRTFGAVAMLETELLRKFAEKVGEDFLVLPSSIHEVILVPVSNLPDSEYIKEMIREINNTNVDPEEQLSNNYYYYDSSAGELKLI